VTRWHQAKTRARSALSSLAALKAGSRRFSAFVLLAIVLVATLGGGRAYWWCASMQQAVDACCCAHDDAEDGAIQPGDGRASSASALRGDCCASRTTDTLPTAQVPPLSLELPASLAAAPALPVEPVLDAPWPLRTRFAESAPATARYGPTRAGPQSAAKRCASLQVFHC